MNQINNFISNLTKAQKIVLAIIVPLALLVIVWTICNKMDWISYGTTSVIRTPPHGEWSLLNQGVTSKVYSP